MYSPFEFGLVANILKEHRWFFNMQLLIGHGYIPTIMPEASKKETFNELADALEILDWIRTKKRMDNRFVNWRNRGCNLIIS